MHLRLLLHRLHWLHRLHRKPHVMATSCHKLMVLLSCKASKLEWSLADWVDKTKALVLVSSWHGKSWIVHRLMMVDIRRLLGCYIWALMNRVLHCVDVLLQDTVSLWTVPLLALTFWSLVFNANHFIWHFKDVLLSRHMLCLFNTPFSMGLSNTYSCLLKMPYFYCRVFKPNFVLVSKTKRTLNA